jgi:membrane protein
MSDQPAEPVPDERGRWARQFWEIPSKGWREVAVRTWKETSRDNISLLAAGVAFYSFLAFVPLLAAVVLIYGMVADPADIPRQMESLTRILPTDAAKIVAEQLKGMTETQVSRSAVGLVFALLLAIYGAMRGATSIIGALNITYGEDETRSILRTTVLSLGFTVGAVLVAVVATLAIGAMSLLGTVIHLPPFMAPLLTLALWTTTAIVASALIAAVYRYGPDRADARWSWLTPGSAFASVGALLATFLFGLYVSKFAHYNATYGALGAVVSFLMWLYVAAFVVLLGAELNSEIEHQTARDTTTGPEAPMGERGAVMADTVAGNVEPAEKPPAPAASGKQGAEELFRPPAPPRCAPVVAGAATAQASRFVGDMRLGVLPMTLVATGLTQLTRRGHGKRGMMFVASGLLLTMRARRKQSAECAKLFD